VARSHRHPNYGEVRSHQACSAEAVRYRCLQGADGETDARDGAAAIIGTLAVAQGESEATSKRTVEALRAAKVRGQVLGNPNGAAALRRAGKGNAAGLGAIRANADKHALNLTPVLDDLVAKGITSLGAMADALNERGILTPRNGQWHKSSVRNLLVRIRSPQ